MEIKNYFKICLIFFGAIIVLGLAVGLIVNSHDGESVTTAPKQVTESSDYFHGVPPELEANCKIAHGDSAAYLYGVPPAPPFQAAEATIANSVMDGCSESTDELVGYIIEVKEKEEPNALIMFSQGAILIIQDENGRRDKFCIDTGSTSNADISYLPSILIPGNKVKIKVQSCGSGGFLYVMHIKNLKRE